MAAARLAGALPGYAVFQRLGIPEILGRVLAARGIEAEGAERFLNPTLRDQLPDPSAFIDMDRAIERLKAGDFAGFGTELDALRPLLEALGRPNGGH